MTGVTTPQQTATECVSAPRANIVTDDGNANLDGAAAGWEDMMSAQQEWKSIWSSRNDYREPRFWMKRVRREAALERSINSLSDTNINVVIENIELKFRAEAAEARAADLAESNLELSESVTTLTAERDSAIAAVQAERETQKRRDEAIINLIENDRRIDDDTALSYVNLIRAHYESE